MFLTYFKLYKWYQIAQRITYHFFWMDSEIVLGIKKVTCTCNIMSCTLNVTLFDGHFFKLCLFIQFITLLDWSIITRPCFGSFSIASRLVRNLQLCITVYLLLHMQHSHGRSDTINMHLYAVFSHRDVLLLLILQF